MFFSTFFGVFPIRLGQLASDETKCSFAFCYRKPPGVINGNIRVHASLALEGAAALADALQKHNGNFESAFQDYNKNLRPFIEEVQAEAALNVTENFIPRTEEAIRERNKRGF